MKKSRLQGALFALLLTGSFASFFYLNSPAARQKPASLIEKPVARADAEKGDDSENKLVLPDVTVIQKVIDLLERLM